MNKKVFGGEAKLLFALAIMLFNSTEIFAQAAPAPLVVGDKMPDISVQVFKDKRQHVSNMSDYRGKPLLLVFWEPDCGTCIQGMPLLEELIAREGDKVNVLLVTKTKASDVNELFDDSDRLLPTRIVNASRKLSFITEDSTINRLFPHNAYSLEVWIDCNQFYRGITYEIDNLDSLVSVLKGSRLEWAAYTIPSIVNQIELKHYFDSIASWNAEILDFAEFRTFNEQLGTMASAINEMDSITGNVSAVGYFNESFIDLYRIAYYGTTTIVSKQKVIDPRMPLMEGARLQRFDQPGDNDYLTYLRWMKGNFFSYLSRTYGGKQMDVYKCMRQNLDRFFNVKSSIEFKKAPCWVLRRTSVLNQIRSSHGQATMRVIETDSSLKLVIRNGDMQDLFRFIYSYTNSARLASPIFDETGIKGNIDIVLPWAGGRFPYSILRLNLALKKFGLELVKAYRLRPTLIIKDNTL